MSKIYSVLYNSGSVSSWASGLKRLVEQSKTTGTKRKFIAFNRNRFSEESLTGLFGNTGSSKLVDAEYGFIGCAYLEPISLSKPDAGPFISQEFPEYTVAYDGIISGYNGISLLKLFSSGKAHVNWHQLVRGLRGQFALLMLSQGAPRRIYYAVKAKPLYMLYDGLGRGVAVASSEEAFHGLYHPTRSPRPVRLEPYTCGYISLDGIISDVARIDRDSGKGSLVLCGGGLDSLVAAWDNQTTFPDEPTLLVNFDYGARARKQEWSATLSIADEMRERFGVPISVAGLHLELSNYFQSSLLTGSTVNVSSDPVPGIASEWVPARNTIMTAMALGIAEATGLSRIVTGINQDAATAYPDNDIEWHHRWNELIPFTLGSERALQLESPLKDLSKVDIVKLGTKLEIPWKRTASWSCYNGYDRHCGHCSSCNARKRAFALARVTDHTEYQS